MTTSSSFVHKGSDQVAETNNFLLETAEWSFSMSLKWLLKKTQPPKRSMAMSFLLPLLKKISAIKFDTFHSHYLKYLQISTKAIRIALGEKENGKKEKKQSLRRERWNSRITAKA